MKQGIRFVIFIVVSFVAVFSAYLFIKGRADAKKYAAELNLIESCNPDAIKKIKVDSFTGDSTRVLNYTEALQIKEIVTEIQKAKPPYFEGRHGLFSYCRLHMFTHDGREITLDLSKDNTRLVRIKYAPEGMTIFSRGSEELSFLFSI